MSVLGGSILAKNEGKIGLFSSIKKSRISDEVYKQIVSLISSGQLKPGDKILSAKELASELGISRQSIREAMNRAEVMGLIKVRQGEGSFILSSFRESMKQPLAVIIEKEAERIFDFLEIRKVVEGWCAEKAALEATDEDLDGMHQLLEEMKKIASKDKRWEELDVALHFAIATATHNVIAIHIMEAIEGCFSTFFKFRSAITSSEKMDVLWQHHNAIYKAIRRRDSFQAKKSIVDHLDFIEEKIREDIGKMEPD
jgi:GntR family transcriptional repressor for pyruvate dehydrogenase complex